MPGPTSRSWRQRRQRAKATVDFATGEVHDRLVDAADAPETQAPERTSSRARAANEAKKRRWVKARKIP